MKNDELKERLISVLQEGAARGGVRRTTSYDEQWDGGILVCISPTYTKVEIDFDVFADALIAAGLHFDENLTATFDHMALEREHELERRLAEAERRAEVFERALDMACELLKLDCSTMFNKLGCPDERMDLLCTDCRKQWLIEKVEKNSSWKGITNHATQTYFRIHRRRPRYYGRRG